MRRSARAHQQGFLVITVVLVLAVLAAMALMISTSASLDNAVIAKHADGATLDYVAKSGMEHMTWQLAQNTSCTAYADLPVTPFGAHSYAATVTPTSGSPVTLASTGTLTSGATRTLTRNDVKVFTAPTTTTLQAGAAGDDTYIRDGANDSRNFGAATILKINNQSAEEASLLKFDLSAIGGAEIISATLDLWLAGGEDLNNGVIDVHRVTQSWVEGDEDGQAPVPGTGATYNSYNGQTNWATAGGDYAAQPLDTEIIPGLVQGWHQWDLTSVAQDWVAGTAVNDGVLLRASGGNVRKIWFTSGDGNATEQPKLTITYACECGKACAAGIGAEPLVLSTASGASLGGLSFTDKDLAEYGIATDTATLFLDGIALGLAEDIDAVHVLSNGHIVLSTINTITLGGVTAENEDLIDYDPVTDTAALMFDGSALFTSGSTDISAVHVMGNGNLLLTNEYSATLGGLSFQPNDIIKYDSATDSATMFFDGSAVSLSGWIDAVHLLDNGNLILSTNTADTLGGLSMAAGDLVEYETGTDTATLYFDGGLFASAENVRSVHVGPGSGALVPAIGPQKVLFVVGNAASLTSEETAHQTLIESWGHAIDIIDDGASQGAFDTAVANNDVVYMTNDITSNNLGTKLVDATIGVVTSEDNLSDEFGMASNIAWESGSDIGINNNSHYITSPFPIGTLTVFSTSESLAYVTGSLSPNLGLLARSTTGPALVTLDTGASMYGGGSAAGRRVQLPWGGTPSLEPNDLTADGLTILQRAIEWGAGAGNATGPIAHWKLDDGVGTTAIDSEGGHDGTLTNGPAWVAGQIAGALNFDGSNDYVDLTSDAELDDVFGGGATVMAWIRPTGWGEAGYGRIFDKSSSPSSTNDGWVVRMNVDNGGIINFGQGFTGGRGWWAIPNGSISLGAWQHIAVAYDADSAVNDPIIYVNGSPLLVTEKDTPSGDLRSDAAINLRLGNYAGGTTHTFDGIIDDARIYDRMLNDTEIADIASAAGGGGGGGGSCDGNFRDEFNSEGYGNNDGSFSWSTNWLEVNESDGWDSGDERVDDNDSDFHLQVRDNDGGGEGVQREADLSPHTAATFSFDYRRDGFDNSNDYVMAQVSNNGGGSWTELDRFSGPGTDSSYVSRSYDISSFISSDTRVRFLTSPNHGSGDELYIDNIEIAVTGCASP